MPLSPVMEVRPFLTLSTAHVSEETRLLLEDEPSRFTGGSYGPNGWFLWCSTENFGDAPIPDDLWQVMEFARAHGCDYILLDRDGNMIDGLPTWE